MQPLLATIREMAEWTRAALGEERLAWLQALPRAPAEEASDAELGTVYGPLDRDIATYAHIHRPFIRNILTIR